MGSADDDLKWFERARDRDYADSGEYIRELRRAKSREAGRARKQNRPRLRLDCAALHESEVITNFVESHGVWVEEPTAAPRRATRQTLLVGDRTGEGALNFACRVCKANVVVRPDRLQDALSGLAKSGESDISLQRLAATVDTQPGT